MVTFEELVEAGWYEHAINTHVDKHDRNCKLVVKKKNKNLYSINANEWDFTKFDNVPIGKQISCKAEFYKGDDLWFTVGLHDCHHKSIEEITAFFSKIYRQMHCVPDIHNN